MVEKFFIPKPKRTDETMPSDVKPSTMMFRIYLDGEEKVKWSGERDLPEIGDEVVMSINSIGPGIVKGYFTAAGFLGVMVKATNPPKWLVKQNREDKKAPAWRKENIACVFGIELNRHDDFLAASIGVGFGSK